MLKQRKDAAENLARRLFETERAIDNAINKLADLTGYMPIARTTANLSAVIGQEAITQAAAALNSLVGARGQIVETHHKLAEARDQIGLRTMAVGDHDSKPPLQGAVDRDPLVKLVNSAA